jgi:hypothetical protein
MARRGIGESVIQYGIRLNGSKSVLMVTETLPRLSAPSTWSGTAA